MSTLAITPNSRKIKNALKSGLRPFIRPVPQTLSDWANANFYLSSESSYVEGPWETLPFQVAPMNSIGHADIEVINFIKSARVGYTQILRAAIAYFTSHKARNQLLYQPTDSDAENFMKLHVETMIRDVKPMRALCPWLGKKHRNSTLDTKVFTNKKSLWVFGGKAARNYREKSVDNVYYDELAAFDSDIEKEGSPTKLGDKRLEGSVFPKSIRGSTPKIQGACQITKAGDQAECYMQFHLPCPECGEEQTLKFGGKDLEYGLKWNNSDPKTAHYVCEKCACIINNTQLEWMEENGTWRCRDTGAYTNDGIEFFDKSGKIREAPRTITYHIWTAYSLFTTWSKIVQDFLDCKDDRSELKTFTNTTLGETWIEDEGQKLDDEFLYARREHYKSECPLEEGIITCAVDTQDDRLEIEHVLWVAGEESYRLNYERLYGDLSRQEIWTLLKKKVVRQFKTPSGNVLEARMCFIDSGGHFTDEVYKFCRKNGLRKFLPIKGHHVMGKPVVSWPRKMNEKKVYLVMVGTDTAKELIANRLVQTTPGEGYMHYPIDERFNEEFFRHLTNEKRVLKVVRGKKTYIWDSGGRRNEPFDLAVYNLAAIRALQQHFGIVLPQSSDQTYKKPPDGTKRKTKANKQTKIKSESEDFINFDGDWF